MAAPTLKFWKGKTFGPLVARVEKQNIVYKLITGIANSSPVRLTCPSHGLTSGWRAAVTGVKGMTEINAADARDIIDDDFHEVTVIDANTIEFNDTDAGGFRPYTSGGVVQYFDAFALAGMTARMAIKAKAGTSKLLKCATGGTSGTTKPVDQGKDGSVIWTSVTSGTPIKEWTESTSYIANDIVDLTDLLRLTTENGRITIDASAKTITLQVSAADTAAISWKRGEYDLELVSSDFPPIVRSLFGDIGSVEVINEVTNN